MILTLFYFILALLLLVTVHEYGHFLVARWCGVKVLRFSFGFGKILARWRDKRGTEYVWSLVPLGGYVKMLDESEGEVNPEERHLAFNNKPVWARIAIVIAGPFFNFLFAFVAFWLVLVIGINSLAPIIERVKEDSVAAKAGLSGKEEILTFNRQEINSWRDFQYALMPLIGSDSTVPIVVKSLADGQKKTIFLPLKDWKIDANNPDPLISLGIEPFIPTIPPIIGEVVENSPAESAKLQPNDVITRVNDQPLGNWLELVEIIRKNPGNTLLLEVLRKGQSKMITVHVGTTKQHQGFLGLRSQKVDWPKSWLRVKRQGPIAALSTASRQTVNLTSATFSLIGRFITGKLGLGSLSGPVGIAQGAGESGRNGIAYYLSFLAIVSISLGVLNLLPIPMLDGGHLLYYVFEVITGRPLAQRFKTFGLYIGLIVLITLMVLGLSNDLSRLGNL